MKRLITAALALSLLGGTAALADPHGHDNDHGRYENHGYDKHRGYDDHGRYDNNRYDNHRYDNHRHHWSRGERLPVSYYRDRGHYVDYRVYHLRAPPRGYQWVRVDDNYALVALTSGLIASIIASGN